MTTYGQEIGRTPSWTSSTKKNQPVTDPNDPVTDPNDYQSKIDAITEDFPLIDLWDGDYQTSADYKYGTLYTNTELNVEPNDGMPNYYRQRLVKNFYDILSYADTNHIPLVAHFTKVNGGCGLCNSIRSSIKMSQAFANNFTKSKYLFYTLGYVTDPQYIGFPDQETSSNKVQQILGLLPTSEMGWFGDHYLYWNIDDKRIIRIRMNAAYVLYASNFLYRESVINKVYKTFDDYIERYCHNLSGIEDNSIGFNQKFFDDEDLKEKWFNGVKYPELVQMGRAYNKSINPQGLTILFHRLNLLFGDYKRQKQYENDQMLKYLN